VPNPFQGPNLAEIDRAAYSNRLMRNDVDRIPQRNAAEDMAIQADQQTMGQNRTDNARRMAADMFTAIADAPDPISTGAMLVQSQAFREIGGELKLPVDQFRPAQGDDPEQIRAAARSWAQAVGAGSGQQSRVQSTQVLEDGTIAYVTSDGQLVKTGERARNPMQLANVGGAPAMVDRLNAQVTPLSTPEQETQAAASRAAATTTATTTAQAAAETQNVQRANERTLGVWQVAREGLVKALAGTETGPITGRMPAVTSGQQIAEGAVAAVAPVLKQLFRSAGEGVFTDRDQQLLLDMVPTRTDHPEAAQAKLGMIDAIIQAKLTGGATQSGPQVGTVEDGYRFIGGDPSQPTSWQRVQ
jgi:hypothetical protein